MAGALDLKKSRKKLCEGNRVSADDMIVVLTLASPFCSSSLRFSRFLCSFKPNNISMSVAIASNEEEIVCEKKENINNLYKLPNLDCLTY